jgi:hypothetical protein
MRVIVAGDRCCNEAILDRFLRTAGHDVGGEHEVGRE